MSAPHDVVVVGGGPAGLSAALVLGRARKRTLLLDSGTPRNASSHGVHGYLGLDGLPPAELRRRAREELSRYPSVEVRETAAASIERAERGLLRAALGDGGSVVARRVLVATGVVDVMPKLAGVREAWGKGAFGCPYCHGWEHRDRRWGVLAMRKSALKAVPVCRGWTRDVMLFLDGRTDVAEDALASLRAQGIAIEPRPIASLVVEDGALAAVEVRDAETSEKVACDAFLLHPAQRQSDLVLFSGLALDDDGYVRVDDDHQTSMRGVHAAGDVRGGRPQVIVAAADGAEAAIQIAELLTIEDLAIR
jgi:thioredoxin reductase